MEDNRLKKGLNETFKKEGHEGHEHGKKASHEHEGHEKGSKMEREAEGKKKSSAECGCKYF